MTIEKKIPPTSVKSYQQKISAEKQKMATYSRGMKKSVRSLQNEFKEHSRNMERAAVQMVEEGCKKMTGKITKFKGDIRSQIKENKEAATRLENSIKLFLSEVNREKKAFQAYIQGPFAGYIKDFWG